MKKTKIVVTLSVSMPREVEVSLMEKLLRQVTALGPGVVEVPPFGPMLLKNEMGVEIARAESVDEDPGEWKRRAESAEKALAAVRAALKTAETGA